MVQVHRIVPGDNPIHRLLHCPTQERAVMVKYGRCKADDAAMVEISSKISVSLPAECSPYLNWAVLKFCVRFARQGENIDHNRPAQHTPGTTALCRDLSKFGLAAATPLLRAPNAYANWTQAYCQAYSPLWQCVPANEMQMLQMQMQIQMKNPLC